MKMKMRRHEKDSKSAGHGGFNSYFLGGWGLDWGGGTFLGLIGTTVNCGCPWKDTNAGGRYIQQGQKANTAATIQDKRIGGV